MKSTGVSQTFWVLGLNSGDNNRLVKQKWSELHNNTS